MTATEATAEASAPPTTKEARIDALLAELDDIRPRLDEAANTTRTLSARRKDVLVELRDLGVQDKTMAEHTGQQVGTVTQAIREHKLRLAGKPITRKKKKDGRTGR